MVSAVASTRDTGPAQSFGARTVSGLQALFPWRPVVLPWLVSRALCAGVIMCATSWPFGDGLRFWGFQRWDGVWYTAIARDGYGALPVGDLQTRWPFFPLLPGLMHGFGEIGIGDQAATVILNELVLLLAFAGVYRIARRHASTEASVLAVWALALFPASFLFSMIYPSSIFLAASVWAFVLVEDRRDIGAAAVVAGATMVRPNGILLVLAIAVALRSWRRIALVCTPAVVLVAAWCAWLWDRTGDPIVFWNAKSAWPEVTVFDLFVEPWRYDYAWPHFLLGVAAAWVVWRQRRRLPVSWIVWTGLLLLVPMYSGIVGLGRYANECFPPFVAAGQVLERWSPRARRIAFGLSVAGLLFAAVMVIRYDRIP
ncbi:MAG TPA: glycosyltransferase family 39 protein [Acidimicrobiia bacterium]